MESNNEETKVTEMKKELNTTDIETFEADPKAGYCECCMKGLLHGGICYHGPKTNDGNGNGIKCDGYINSKIKGILKKNTESKPSETCYYITTQNLACAITDGDITACNISKEDLMKVVNNEAVLIIDHIVIGVDK